MNQIIAIVQARMASTRLPGKILLPLMEKTVLEQVINRVRPVKNIHEIIVATSVNNMDDIVESFCKEKGIQIFRGSEDDVLERFYLCAKEYQADVVVRITADDPLKDPAVIEKAVSLFLEGDYDYVSNTIVPTYPEGIDVEIFSFKALKKAYEEAKLSSEREHVTPYLYKNPMKFKLHNFTYSEDLSELRLTMDTPEDYLLIKKVYKELYQKPDEIFSMQDILILLRQNPELASINKGHVRNEGYLNSLKLDDEENSANHDEITEKRKENAAAKEEKAVDVEKKAVGEEKKAVGEEEKAVGEESKSTRIEKKAVNVYEKAESIEGKATSVEDKAASVEDKAASVKDNAADEEKFRIKEKRFEQLPLTKRIYGNELKYVNQVLSTQFRSSQGAVMMSRLEEAFAKKIGTKYAIAMMNGTCTLHAILEAAGIGVKDEVIVPPLTMSSTTFAVLHANATPIYADIDPNTFTIDPISILKRITRRTKAIITVSLYGLSPDMDIIMKIAAEYHLLVIEDNAECLLGTYKGRMVGTLGHIASYSFQSSKHITSGEGGMVVTDSYLLAQSVRRVSSLGYAGVDASKGKITKETIQDPDYSRHISMGWNYRMPELCAAVALGQLENADALVSRRIKAAKLYEEAVGDTEWLLPQFVGDDHVCTYWTYAVRLLHPTITWKEFRDQYVAFGGDGIYAAWKLTYLEPMMNGRSLLYRDRFIKRKNLNKYKKGLCPIAEELQGQLLQFKTNYWTDEDAHKQANILKRTIDYFDERREV